MSGASRVCRFTWSQPRTQGSVALTPSLMTVLQWFVLIWKGGITFCIVINFKSQEDQWNWENYILRIIPISCVPPKNWSFCKTSDEEELFFWMSNGNCFSHNFWTFKWQVWNENVENSVLREEIHFSFWKERNVQKIKTKHHASGCFVHTHSKWPKIVTTHSTNNNELNFS